MKLLHVKSIDKGTHTIDVNRLTPGGWTLDAGCYGMDFSKKMLELGQIVVAVDPACVFTHDDLATPNLFILKVALAAQGGPRYFHEDKDPLISKLCTTGEMMVFCMSVADIMTQNGIHHFDVVKLDIEGAELNCLKGAEMALRTFRPRLAIAASVAAG